MNSQLTLNTLTASFDQKSFPKPVSKVMMSRHTCPCCGTTLLRHARSGEIYWRCSSCYQEMPVYCFRRLAS